VQIDDSMSLLEAIERKTQEMPALHDAILRVAPASHCFIFRSADDFRDKANAIVREWAAQLAGRSFHCRLHRRGGRHALWSPDVRSV